MNIPYNIIEELAEVARDKGISQKVISEKSGLPQKTVSLILTGKSVPNLSRFCLIANALGVRITFDFG